MDLGRQARRIGFESRKVRDLLHRFRKAESAKESVGWATMGDGKWEMAEAEMQRRVAYPTAQAVTKKTEMLRAQFTSFPLVRSSDDRH